MLPPTKHPTKFSLAPIDKALFDRGAWLTVIENPDLETPVSAQLSAYDDQARVAIHLPDGAGYIVGDASHSTHFPLKLLQETDKGLEMKSLTPRDLVANVKQQALSAISRLAACFGFEAQETRNLEDGRKGIQILEPEF